MTTMVPMSLGEVVWGMWDMRAEDGTVLDSPKFGKVVVRHVRVETDGVVKPQTKSAFGTVER